MVIYKHRLLHSGTQWNYGNTEWLIIVMLEKALLHWTWRYWLKYWYFLNEHCQHDIKLLHMIPFIHMWKCSLLLLDYYESPVSVGEAWYLGGWCVVCWTEWVFGSSKWTCNYVTMNLMLVVGVLQTTRFIHVSILYSCLSCL